MMKVLKNVVGSTMRLAISHATRRATTARPISETTLGLGRFRRFASGEGGSVRACVAIRTSPLKTWGRASALPQVPFGGL
jgi:hypothetical protein